MKTWFLKKLQNLLPFMQKKVKRNITPTADEILPAEQECWWGSFLIEEEQSRFFKIGELVTCVDRFDQKWHITTYHEGQQPFKTFAAQTSNEITFKPTLPDRALLCALDRPCYIPAGETLLIYTCAPLWIQISAGTPPITLEEFATETLTDTWFGKNTQAGELCYDNPIPSSSRLEELPQDATHAIIPVSIKNRSKETLFLEQLKVPLASLAIYSDKQNRLWTEQLNLYQENSNNIETWVTQKSLLPFSDIQLVNTARVPVKAGLKALFSSFMGK